MGPSGGKFGELGETVTAANVDTSSSRSGRCRGKWGGTLDESEVDGC